MLAFHLNEQPISELIVTSVNESTTGCPVLSETNTNVVNLEHKFRCEKELVLNHRRSVTFHAALNPR